MVSLLPKREPFRLLRTARLVFQKLLRALSLRSSWTTYERLTFAFSRSRSASSALRPPVSSGSRVNIHGSPGAVKGKFGEWSTNFDIRIPAFRQLLSAAFLPISPIGALGLK